jgi:hypothetical protein
MANNEQSIKRALSHGDGILHLAPAWVPRSFARPGGRIGIARKDMYAYGTHRGGIDERWLASTTQPANGPDMVPNEGLSSVVSPDGEHVLLKDAIDLLKDAIIGKTMYEKWKKWPVLGKFFDNMGPLPFHLHPDREAAARVGEEHKPEAYYFSPQLNQITHTMPHNYYGLEPGTTKEDVRRCLENWDTGENGILDLSKAYRIENGTGWMTPPGVLHAPASVVTYEIQWGTDTFAMFQSVVEGTVIPKELMVKNVPDDKKDDLDYVLSLVDWEANTRPDFKETFFRPPIVLQDTSDEGYVDKWVIYGTSRGEDVFSSKELTVLPGASATITDPGPSGVIAVQGHGTIGSHDIQMHNYIRFGEITQDEFFITDAAAKKGYTVVNKGADPLVLLRHFGPDCQDPDVVSRP